MGKKKKSAKVGVPPAVIWATTPAAHDYPAAASYLRLLAGSTRVDMCTAKLAEAPTVRQHAKDILRAARLPLLPADDPEVAKDLAKVASGEALSPVLLVRGDFGTGRPLQIADGYHRVCASYRLNEDTGNRLSVDLITSRSHRRPERPADKDRNPMTALLQWR